MWVTSSIAAVRTPTAVALGNFDGVHRGHRQVIQPIVSIARQQWDGLRPHATVLTFDPHPREFFTGESRDMLSPLDEKVERLQALGIEQLLLLPFDRALAEKSPKAFVEEILAGALGATHLSVGENFRFGKERAGNAIALQKIAAAYGTSVTIVPLEVCDGDRASSSAIRRSLADGDLERAEQMLGRPYALEGKVVAGAQLGRTLGFPTANLQLPPKKFLPRFGVYGVWAGVRGADRTFSGALPGVANLGCRPTVDGKTPSVEVHLLDWQGDLYGKILRVKLVRFLRPERKFASLDELKAQIRKDGQKARAALTDGAIAQFDGEGI